MSFSYAMPWVDGCLVCMLVHSFPAGVWIIYDVSICIVMRNACLKCVCRSWICCLSVKGCLSFAGLLFAVLV